MVKEKKFNGNVISRRFETMMPLDVFAGITRFAKENAGTGLGKFDYSVALRILLERNSYYEVVSEIQEDLLRLQAQVNELTNKLNVPQPAKNESKVKTFGN